MASGMESHLPTRVGLLVATIALALAVAFAGGERRMDGASEAHQINDRTDAIRNAVAVCIKAIPKVAGEDGKLFVGQDDLRSCVVSNLCTVGENNGRLMGEGCGISDEELRKASQ